jgi:hypothetical protein
MTNEDLATKISSQITALEGTMKGAIDGKVAELEAAMTRMRTNLQEQINADLTKIDRNFQITCEQHENLMERVAKIEGSKTTWKERGKQVGYGALGAAVVMGGVALVDWAFSSSSTTTQNQ